MFQLRAHTMVRARRKSRSFTASGRHRQRTRLLLEVFEERLCPDAMTINYTDSGSWSQAGNHDSHNKNYIAGRNSGTEFRDYLVFNLGRIQGYQEIIGAELRVYNPQTGFSSPNPTETYTLSEVSTPISELRASGTGRTDIFQDLGSGTALGARDFSNADNNHVVSMPLSDAALAYLNSARGGLVALGGVISTLSGTANEYVFRDGGNDGDTRQLVLDVEPAAGPVVLRHTPNTTVAAGVSAIRFSFDIPIDVKTFTRDQVDSFTGPGGAIPFQDIQVVPGSGDRQVDVTFSPQVRSGRYTMVIGPNILDTMGRPMDQDTDGIGGQVPDDQYTAMFTIQTPAITAYTPSDNRFGPVSNIRVTFNESMNVSTFTTGRVSIRGPGGAIGVSGVNVVPDTGNTQFDVSFAPQTRTGRYNFTVSSGIQDVWGNATTQAFNGNFGLLGPRIIGSSPSGILPAGSTASSVRVTFDEPMDPATFTPDKIASFTKRGISGPISIDVQDVNVVPQTNNTQFDITFALQGVGDYRMVIGPDIRDTFGNQMDQNNNLVPGEIPGDEFTATFAIGGAQVLRGAGFPDHVRLTFNIPMNPDSFTPKQVHSLTAPDGSDIPVKDVTVVPDTNDTQFDISYAQQTLDGTYHMVVGPDILDQSGNEMDQNNDFIPGEVPDDQFVFNFNPLTRNLDDFEGPDLSRYQLSREQWQLSTAAAHDGNQGLSSISTSGEWIYRNDEGAHVAQGDVISVWAQYHGNTSGRIYFGFGASSAGTLSMVLAGNTGELLIQENNGFDYLDIGTVGQTYQNGHWYRMEVTWATGGNITGRLFDSDGITLIRTVTAHSTLFTQGGIAFRGFTGGDGQVYFDTATAQSIGDNPGGAPSGGGGLGRFAQLDSALIRGEPRSPVLFSSNVVAPVSTPEVRHEDPRDGFFATRTGNDPMHDFALPSRENLLALAVREHQPWLDGLFTEENWIA